MKWTTLFFLLVLVAAIAVAGCTINIPLAPGIGALEERVVGGKGNKKIVLVDISGMITAEPDSQGLGPDLPSIPARLQEELNKAADDDDVRGIVLRINSPGGTVSASDTIYHEILSFKKQSGKKVYAAIIGLGTSGAYYVASAADRIYAQPTAVTGSIGVIAVNVDASGLMEKVGVRNKTVKSGPKKDIFSPLRADTPEEREIMQKLIDSMHERFIDVVAEGRDGRITRSKVEELADGRPYTAVQAHEAGLIDEIGYLDDAIANLKNELGIRKALIVAYARPGEYRNSLYAAPPGKVNVNLLNLNLGTLVREPGVKFLYLWGPEL
jgi:protease-4